MTNLFVIGIGYTPLDVKTREVVLSAGVILASRRLFEVFQRYEEFEAAKDKVQVINTIDETMNVIRSRLSSPLTPDSPPIVLLASGDPLFFGIGRRIVQEFGQEAVEIMPDLSSIQVAFARIREPWDKAFLMSLHGGPDPAKRRRLPYELEDLPALLDRHSKIAILTDKENSPARIASFLNSSPLTPHSLLTLHVCERLGYPDEKITSGTPAEIEAGAFSDPNVVIVMRGQGSRDRTEIPEVRFGLTEDEIAHSRGLITKDEVRAVTIHKLKLPRKGVFWDIGAGSASVSIEIARFFPDLRIFAIEKDGIQMGHIEENRARFSVSGLRVIQGEAPAALAGLPAPHRVFIGGSSGKLDTIIDHIAAAMESGIVVVNATTLETLYDAILHLEKHGFSVEVAEISVSRSTQIGKKKRYMKALNPVFVIKGEKNK